MLKLVGIGIISIHLMEKWLKIHGLMDIMLMQTECGTDNKLLIKV